MGLLAIYTESFASWDYNRIKHCYRYFWCTYNSVRFWDKFGVICALCLKCNHCSCSVVIHPVPPLLIHRPKQSDDPDHSKIDLVTLEARLNSTRPRRKFLHDVPMHMSLLASRDLPSLMLSWYVCFGLV